MTLPARRRGDDTGTLASSSAAVAAGIAVLAAAVYYFATGGPDPSNDPSVPPTASSVPSPTATESATQSPTPTGTPSATPTEEPSPSESAAPVRRSKVQVAVFNASRVTGLAGATATRLEKLGWVVGRVDNWSGSLSASTVFYTPGNRPAAQLLAEDLGLGRVRPATSEMPARGLTLILTGELA